MAACLRFTRKVWETFLRNKGHDAQCIPNLKIVAAKPGRIEASLKIEPYNLNRTQSLHGGLILTLTDTLGSLAVASKGHFMTGVSTDIGASFLKPGGGAEDIITGKAVVSALGKTLAYTRVDFLNAKGDLVAFGHHTKFVGKSHGHEKNVEFSEDGEEIVKGKELSD